MTIPKGTVFLVTQGEYSDYRVNGLYQANHDLDEAALFAEYPYRHKWPYIYEHEGSVEFEDWLEAAGHISPVEHWGWHLGDYRLGDTKDTYDIPTSVKGM